jgi:HNH endonuclease
MYISAGLRRRVEEADRDCCAYCRLRRTDHILPFEIDHIVSLRHSGDTVFENLCLSCYDCNHNKASDIASADPLTKIATFIFNPRTQKWDDHFRLNGSYIEPLTPEGRVTVFLLDLNAESRIEERTMLTQLGSYPC